MQLAKFYSEYLNKEITINDVQRICSQLTAFYRNNGYILSKVIVPPQEIDNEGTLTIQIIEGYIDQVSVEGDLRPATKNLLLRYAKHIASQRPLTLKNLERYVLLANDLPSTKVKALIKASDSTSGAGSLTFVATQMRNDWYAGANNFNSELLGRNQMVGGINANGYLLGSQTGLRAVLGFDVSRLKYFALTHRQQLNSDGWGIDALLSNTNTNPNLKSISLNGFQTPGQAFIINANTQYAYIRSRNQNLIVGAGFNYLNSHSSSYGIELFNDAIRSIDLRASYNFVTKDLSMHNIDLYLYQGINILDAHASPPSIPGGKTNFTKVTLSANRYQKLIINHLYLLIWGKGQYSFTQLLSSEKFGFGGAPFGYGYDPSVITGDDGYALKVEPQYNYQIGKSYLKQLQIFGFFDTSSIWNRNKIVQPGHQSATSMGFGTRAMFYKRLYVELILAQPFSVFVTNNNKNNTRILFNFNYNGGLIFG